MIEKSSSDRVNKDAKAHLRAAAAGQGAKLRVVRLTEILKSKLAFCGPFAIIIQRLKKISNC